MLETFISIYMQMFLVKYQFAAVYSVFSFPNRALQTFIYTLNAICKWYEFVSPVEIDCWVNNLFFLT